MDQSSTNKDSKKVQFTDTTVEHDANYSFDEDDIEIMFYTNDEVNEILQECKKQDDLPLFWKSLRVHRIELLWDEVDKEQYYQQHKLAKEEAAKRDLLEDLARVSRKITQPLQVVAVKEAKKIAREVEEIMRSTIRQDKNELVTSSIHRSTPTEKKELDSPKLNGLQSIKRNSIAAGVA